MLVAKVQVSGMPVAKGQVSIMLVATADKLRLYRCSSPRERYDANFCNLVLAAATRFRECAACRAHCPAGHISTMSLRNR
jgi:hypothetical protein